MRKVLFFKENLLPPSETFILEQVRTLTGYTPILAGLERAHPSLPLPQEPILLSDRGPSISDARAKLYRRTGTAPVFHHRANGSRPDVVHAHFASGGRTAIHLARSLRLPLIVTLYGSDVTIRKSPADGYKRLGEQASLFLCVSRFIRDRAIEAGFPPAKLLVHYLGIDLDVFSPPSTPCESQGVLFVGRLVEKKGCEYLLRAMQLVQRSHPRSELTIIGEGPLRPSLEALAKELDLRCQFRGVQPAAIVREALQKAHIFCVPSLMAANGDSEGLGVVFGEAQAMGVPVVSSQHGGIPEIVLDGVTGLLAPERDFEQLAAHLARYLEEPEFWAQSRQEGMRWVRQQFDVHSQTAKLEAIYDGVIREFQTGNRHYLASAE
jgi:colanic acid/amylovoran biosynthesis glycosyltransferase